MIEKRSIGLCIVLSIVTCGLYSIYWIYKVDDDISRVNGEESKAGINLLLSMVTCGIYFIYLNYMWGKKIDTARQRNGGLPKDDSVLFVVLAIFGLSIVNMCIIQSSLNDDFNSTKDIRNN